IKNLKKKGKDRQGRKEGDTDRTCPDSGPPIGRCKKHNRADIPLPRIIAMVCGVENVENIGFFG
ncbi:MAG: hypothetical protein LBP32_05800, partial [Spirochaetaceae bacterium]|nr:hypothetical protein [Spirochaetaceae bacterium]